MAYIPYSSSTDEFWISLWLIVFTWFSSNAGQITASLLMQQILPAGSCRTALLSLSPPRSSGQSCFGSAPKLSELSHFRWSLLTHVWELSWTSTRVLLIQGEDWTGQGPAGGHTIGVACRAAGVRPSVPMELCPGSSVPPQHLSGAGKGPAVLFWGVLRVMMFCLHFHKFPIPSWSS